MNDVYITRLAMFLPNEAVGNDDMEARLGLVDSRPSRARRIVLRQNGITSRHYAIDASGNVTHTNYQLTAEAIRRLFTGDARWDDVDLLACGTSSPDHLVPSHAVMVHGELGGRPIEIASASGVCCSAMHALKHAFLAVRADLSHTAVCTGSELVSPVLRAQFFQGETEHWRELEAKPMLVFEKEFLRWMLSDGAGAALLTRARPDGMCLRIDWIENLSFAHVAPPCMVAGGERLPSGAVRSWKELAPHEWLERSVFALQQDARLLEHNIMRWAGVAMTQVAQKRRLRPEDVDFLLPHLSSEYFRVKLDQRLREVGFPVPQERWFTNLSRVGNVGSASIFLMLEELFRSSRLRAGQRLMLAVPESARFSFSVALLTVC
jgi:3-oxoacyl-[acyl-carrier-protein] synthase-3